LNFARFSRHSGNTGSIPVRDAKAINELHHIAAIRRSLWPNVCATVWLSKVII
jgi:hypothetical protein